MERLQELKLYSIDIADHYAMSDREDFHRYAERILNCAPRLQLKVDFSQHINDSWLAHIEEAWWCKVRHCPICQRVRISKSRGKMYKGLNRLNLEHPNLYWAFFTFTIRNCDAAYLRSTMRQMGQGWHRLLNGRFGLEIEGYARAFEITRNPKTGQANPHYHTLFCSRIPFRHSIHEWSRLWGQALNVDYNPVVDGRRVKDFSKSLLELVKYTSKPSDLSSDANWLYEVSDQLHRMRSLTTGGLIGKYVSQRVLNQIDKEICSGDERSQQGKIAYASWDYRNQVYDLDFA